MLDAPLLETLREIRFLEDLEEQHLEEIARLASLCQFDAGQTVFREGQAARHLYLVIVGNLSLEFCAAGVGCKQILTVGPGEMIGWWALSDRARATATARSLSAVQLVKVDGPQLLTLCEHNPRFGFVFMRHTVQALSIRLNASHIQLLDVYGSSIPAARPALEGSHGH